MKFTYTYDVRVPLEQLYTGTALKQDRNVRVTLPHVYTLKGVVAKADMQALIGLVKAGYKVKVQPNAIEGR